mmetsp:Transcript_15030/g.19820  ORF Transcript_15030/g.19820 Transcript_15030/m.19820 type:complete len:308 (-) Transcript_15030:201-1124(-)
MAGMRHIRCRLISDDDDACSGASSPNQDLFRLLTNEVRSIDPDMLSIKTSPTGRVSGVLIQYIGELLSLMDSSNCKAGTIEGVNITKKYLLAVIHGIYFNFGDPSCEYMKDFSFSTGEAWLTDDHIEIALGLIRQKIRETIPDHKSALITSHSPAKLEGPDADEALNWLRITLIENDLLSDAGLTLKTLLIPFNVKNRHWVLIHLCFVENTFPILDPLSLLNPSVRLIGCAREITGKIVDEFGLGQFSFAVYDFGFPDQSDGYNCGIYVISYMIYLSMGPGNNVVDFSLNIDAYRAMFVSWILRQSL